MDTTQVLDWQTFNTTDGVLSGEDILAELQRRKKPVLIISRSKPRAWLYPYEIIPMGEDVFSQWHKKVLPKYAKIKVKKLIALIRKDRDQR